MDTILSRQHGASGQVSGKPGELQDEGASALTAIEEFTREVRPLLPPAVAVVSCDSAFATDDVRRAWRQAGVVENIHGVAHRNNERADEYRNKIHFIRSPTHPAAANWVLDGHYQGHCACGRGHHERLVSLDTNGRAIVRLRLRCARCGSLTLTSGEWRKVKATRRGRPNTNEQDIRPVRHGGGEPDLAVGNPLTFDDVCAREYGADRFGSNEGFFGAFSQRFGLLAGKGWFCSGVEAETGLAVALCLIYALSLEYYQRVGQTRAAAGPPASLPNASAAPKAGGAQTTSTTTSSTKTVPQTLPAAVAAAGHAHTTVARLLVAATSTVPLADAQPPVAGTHGSAVNSRPGDRKRSAQTTLREALRVVRTDMELTNTGARGSRSRRANFDAVFGSERGPTRQAA